MSRSAMLEIAIHTAYQQEANLWYDFYHRFGIEAMCDRLLKRMWDDMLDPTNKTLKKFILDDKYSPLTIEDKAYLAMVEL